MNVYLLELNRFPRDYGMDYACVVIARNEIEAREAAYTAQSAAVVLAESKMSSYGPDWRDKESVICTCVLLDGWGGDASARPIVLVANSGG